MKKVCAKLELAESKNSGPATTGGNCRTANSQTRIGGRNPKPYTGGEQGRGQSKSTARAPRPGDFIYYMRRCPPLLPLGPPSRSRDRNRTANGGGPNGGPNGAASSTPADRSRTTRPRGRRWRTLMFTGTIQTRPSFVLDSTPSMLEMSREIQRIEQSHPWATSPPWATYR